MIRYGILSGILGLAVAVGLYGCKREEPECIPSGKVNVVEVEKIPLPKGDLQKYRNKLDQCHACVKAPAGFYSCQVAWQKRNETREELKKKAKELACEDAGYEKGKCPDEAVRLVQCKGDTPPKETALSRSFKRLLVNAKEGKPVNSHIPADVDESDNAGTPAPGNE
jgi:hypothetical protein